MTIYLGILLALACAFTTNLAFLYKHRGACAAPAVHVHHPLTSARALVGSRWFATGILVPVGVSDVAIKAITGLVGEAGLLHALLSPWTLVAVAASVAAFYASAKGLQEGEAVPVIALTGVAANVSGILGGIIVFGDPLPGTAFGIVLQGFAFALVIVAAALTPAPVRAVSAPAAAH